MSSLFCLLFLAPKCIVHISVREEKYNRPAYTEPYSRADSWGDKYGL